MSKSIRTVNDGNRAYKFYAKERIESGRVSSIFDKEAGTIAWLRSLSKDDVLFDIGANIGIYTIFAAPLVKKVVAFEPHLGNAFRLLQNVDLNKFKNVNVIASPIHDKAGIFDFSYRSYEIGESFNQLSDEDHGNIEQKLSLHLDYYVENKSLPTPTAIKLDVDGNEYLILQSMEKTLRLGTVKSLIVEYNRQPGETIANNRIRTFMENLGYKFIESQFTRAGKKRLREGKSPEKIDHNFLFKLK